METAGGRVAVASAVWCGAAWFDTLFGVAWAFPRKGLIQDRNLSVWMFAFMVAHVFAPLLTWTGS